VAVQDFQKGIRDQLQHGRTIQSLARGVVAFIFRYLRLRRQLPPKGKTVLNHELLFNAFNHGRGRRTAYAWSHGADDLSYVGSGILYFALPYMLKAKTCVCIGSGGGYVPRLMHHAQLEAKVEGGRTILVDANKGEWGRPNWLQRGSFLRKRFSAIEIIEMDSVDYAALAKTQHLKIDYLHIDGDHSEEGALSDFISYLPLMSKQGLITFHDTSGRLPCARIIPTVKAMGHDVINLPHLGEGIAIIVIAPASTLCELF
jgi:hypothetical protein